MSHPSVDDPIRPDLIRRRSSTYGLLGPLANLGIRQPRAHTGDIRLRTGAARPVGRPLRVRQNLPAAEERGGDMPRVMDLRGEVNRGGVSDRDHRARGGAISYWLQSLLGERRAGNGEAVPPENGDPSRHQLPSLEVRVSR